MGLSAKEVKDLATADVVTWARDTDSGEDIGLVIEISRRVASIDVVRSERRAAVLTRAGVKAVAAVAGATIGEEAAQAADRLGVVQLIQQTIPDESAA